MPWQYATTYRKRRAWLKMVDKMTRRQKRFVRRKMLREQRKTAFLSRFDDFNVILNRDNLYKAAEDAKKRVMWKGTVQRWNINQLLETEKLFRDISEGKDVRKGFSRFTVYERGKIRRISAVRFYERVVQKCLCKKVLMPVYGNSLIYDNTASQQGKGMLFSCNRLTTHLRRFFKRYGTQGYALLIDFKGYFENINHAALKRLYRRYFKNRRLLCLIDGFVDAYGEKGLGLGSESNQMHAIYFPNEIDHIVNVGGHGRIYYGRYMNDSYVIAPEKSILQRILGKIKGVCEKLKIILSPKKTKIVTLKNGVKWLKTRFYLLENGKIIKKPCRSGIVRERRKLKKQLKLLKHGRISPAEIRQSFESWAGSMKRRNARLTVWKMRQILWSVKL